MAVNKRVKFLPSSSPQEHGVQEHCFACAFVVSVPLTKEFRSIDPIDRSSSGFAGHPVLLIVCDLVILLRTQRGGSTSMEILQVGNGSAELTADQAATTC